MSVLFPVREDDEYFFDEGCHILEVLNDPADPECSIVRARVEHGVTTDWHRLKDTWERYVITAGRGTAFVGEESFEVVAGDIVLIPPMVPQRIRATSIEDLVFLAVCTPPFNAENYLPDR